MIKQILHLITIYPMNLKTTKNFSDWKKLIKSTDFTIGKYVAEFEKAFTNYIGANIVFQ